MKRILSILLLAIIVVSCNEDNDDKIISDTDASATFNFTHNWDNTNVTNADFNVIQFTNEHGEELSIERLRYLISDVTFHKSSGETIVIEDYNLVDVTNNTNLDYAPTTSIPFGEYTNVSFTFGFDNDDNIDGAYTDLNSASWNVPMMLGGGYHFMQFDGKYLNSLAVETGFNYHAIRAVNISGPDLLFQDTFFDVNLGPITISNDVTFEIKMNIAEWFKNPNTWDLNVLDAPLMPNFDAQIMMNENGQSVFSLGTVTQ